MANPRGLTSVKGRLARADRQCLALAERWNKARDDNDLSQFSKKDVADFSSTQLCVFLDKLGEYSALRSPTVRALDELYSLDKSDNAEIKLRFYKIALTSGPEYCDSAASELNAEGVKGDNRR